MHHYVDLLPGITETALAHLNEAERETRERLKTSARTIDVKILQRLNLLRAITALGMFALTESLIQDGDTGQYGFKVAIECLDRAGNAELKQRFIDFKDAINVLKHGRGQSYDRLVKRAKALPFRVKLPEEHLFNEGNVTEVATLIEVDDEFIRATSTVVAEVLACVEQHKS